LSGLAGVLDVKGDYTAAELLRRRALTIWQRTPLTENLGAALALAQLAYSLTGKGDYAGAETLFRRALAIREQLRGPEDLITALSLHDLAWALAGEGQYAAAEPLYRRALSIEEKILGAENSITAASVEGLGAAIDMQGDIERAEPLYRRALAIREKVLGPEHPDTAVSLHNLAWILASKGQYAEAEPLYRRALSIEENALGAEAPNTANWLFDLAGLLWAEGQVTEARILGQRAGRLEATNLSRRLMPFGEAEQRSFLQSFLEVDKLISFQLAQPEDKEARRQVFWALLQRKGRLQEVRAVQQRLATLQPTLFQRWLTARRALDACTTSDIVGTPSTRPVEKALCGPNGLDHETRYRAANEALLALYAAVPREDRDLGVVEVEELLGPLRDGGWTLLEIAEYKVFRPYRPRSETWGGSRYAAYLLFADGRIEFKDLGEADGINAAVAKVRKLEADPTSNMTSARTAAKELYERTLGQLDRELKGQEKLYVAADGDLGLVDFSSLMDRNGHWFLEEHLVVNLTSGSDLVRLERAAAERKGTHGDYLVANPSFLFTDARMAPGSSERAGSTKQALGGPTGDCSVAFGKGGLWPRVGITAQEIGGFRTALPGLKVYEREQARESVVKAIVRPRTLWFITHGFFCQNAPAGGVPKELTERMWDDSMLRGALVLAGAQVGGVGDGEDGYLQSAEIVDRDWQGAELAVLGACETALGVPSIGDGVYGMRRAFIVAGVRSQVMTLWRVSQAPTFELLEAFAKFLHAGKGKAEALREAQRQMLRKYPHPYYWAGFHFTGDPAPLPAN